MPRIRAASIAEHAQAQRAAILRAARALVASKGAASLRFGDVASRAGGARSSVYDYFHEKDDLLVALLEEDAPSLIEEVRSAVAGSATAREGLAAFVESVLRLVESGRHQIALTVGEPTSGKLRTAVDGAHRELFEVLRPLLQQIGVRHVHECMALITGVVMSAGQTLRQAHAPSLRKRTAEFVVAGVEAFVQNRVPSAPGSRGRVVPRATRQRS